jgi:peptidyl-prolyl cis-trans isomerase SurA
MNVPSLRRRLRRRGLAAWLALAAPLLPSLVPVSPVRAAVLDRIAAVVNEDIILESDVNQAALVTFRAESGGAEIDIESPEGQRKFEAHRRKTLDQLIEKQLIVQQGKELKVYVLEDELRRALDDVKRSNGLTDQQFVEALKQQGFSMESYRKTLRQQLLELKVLNQAVRSRITVGDDEVRAYYAQVKRAATGDQLQVQLSQILVAVPKNASEAQVEQKRKVALGLIDQIRGGADFAQLARAHSNDPAAKDGGDLGWMARGDLPEALRDVVLTMDPTPDPQKEVRGPIRSERGFHILWLRDRKEADVRPYEEVKENLRRQLYDQQVEKGVQSWIKELRRKSHIDVRI